MKIVAAVVIMVAALLSTGNGKEPVMGYGWEQYGQQAGYSQAAWDALPQAQKNAIKSWIDGLGGGGSVGGATGSQGYNALAGSMSGSVGSQGYAALDQGSAGAYPAESSYVDDGSGSGYGAAVGGTAARVLNESPEWLAYLNALNLEEQQYRADVDKTRALYQSDAERQKQDLVPVYGQSRRGIAGSLESRGMARSGELLRKLAENRAQEGRQRSGIDANLAGQTLGLESQLAQKMLSLGTQRTEREMSMRSQGYI